MRSDFAGDAQAALLGPANLLEGSFGGKMRDVQARSSKLGELHVAGYADRFGGGGHSGKAKTRGGHTLAHNRTGSERNILSVLDHRKIERAAILHHLACEFCGGDRFAVVGDGDDAGLLHGRDFREGLAFATDACRADGPHVNAGRDFSAIKNEARDAGAVVHRFGVGHTADGGEPSASRGARAGFDGLGGFLAGLAKMRVKIDKAGSDDEPGGIEDFRVAG